MLTQKVPATLCHPIETLHFSRSRHVNTLAIRSGIIKYIPPSVDLPLPLRVENYLSANSFLVGNLLTCPQQALL